MADPTSLSDIDLTPIAANNMFVLACIAPDCRTRFW